MSYHNASIGKLSPAQISKLLNGHAARIMSGCGHKVKLCLLYTSPSPRD